MDFDLASFHPTSGSRPAEAIWRRVTEDPKNPTSSISYSSCSTISFETNNISLNMCFHCSSSSGPSHHCRRNPPTLPELVVEFWGRSVGGSSTDLKLGLNIHIINIIKCIQVAMPLGYDRKLSLSPILMISEFQNNCQ